MNQTTPRLTSQRSDALQASILDLYDHRSLDDFKAALPRIMLKVLPADHFAWNTCTLGPRPKMIGYEESDPFGTPELLEIWAESMAAHPFTDYFIRTGDDSALKLSDFLSQSKIERIPIVRDCLSPIGIRYMMSTATIISHGLIAGLSFGRLHSDFSEEDRTVLNLLRPHVLQARRNAERVHALMLATSRQTAVDRKERLAQLTAREREVAFWLAQGKTNPEIAILLSASPRTIDKHLERIFAKLGVENRTAAALMIQADNDGSPLAQRSRQAGVMPRC